MRVSRAVGLNRRQVRRGTATLRRDGRGGRLRRIDRGHNVPKSERVRDPRRLTAASRKGTFGDGIELARMPDQVGDSVADVGVLQPKGRRDVD